MANDCFRPRLGGNQPSKEMADHLGAVGLVGQVLDVLRGALKLAVERQDHDPRTTRIESLIRENAAGHLVSIEETFDWAASYGMRETQTHTMPDTLTSAPRPISNALTGGCLTNLKDLSDTSWS